LHSHFVFHTIVLSNPIDQFVFICWTLIKLSYLTNRLVEARNACVQVIPCKISVVDRDGLDGDFSKNELFVTLNSIQNGMSPKINGLSCQFFKAMWDMVGDDQCCMAKQHLNV
jgi:hypothetical protein